MIHIVLGASKGLGRAIAIRLAKRGGTLLLTSRSVDALRETEAMIRSARGQANIIIEPIDLRDDLSINEFVAKLQRLSEPVRAMINTSAGFYKGTFLDQPLESIDELMNTTYVGVVRLIGRMVKLVPYEIPLDIINITSVSAATTLDAGRSSSVHIATKAALQTFGVVLGRELSNKGIRICGMAPGTFARKDRPGIPEEVMADCVDFVLDLPPSTCVESIVLRPCNM